MHAVPNSARSSPWPSSVHHVVVTMAMIFLQHVPHPPACLISTIRDLRVAAVTVRHACRGGLVGAALYDRSERVSQRKVSSPLYNDFARQQAQQIEITYRTTAAASLGATGDGRGAFGTRIMHLGRMTKMCVFIWVSWIGIPTVWFCFVGFRVNSLVCGYL
jgi:hypothetical protein